MSWCGCGTALLAVLATTVAGPVGEVTNSTVRPVQERCTLSPEAGSCSSYVYKWYYSPSANNCKLFVFSGCGGNDNRFDSRVECLHYCLGGEHTLPPFLKQMKERRAEGKTEMSTISATTLATRSSTATAVPLSQRDENLTFEETGQLKVFMFAQSNTFIQVDGNRIPTFQLRLCREISFQFRTKLPHGLLVYHSVKERPEGLEPYALYVIVEKGQLKVVHVYKHSTSVTVGEALNDDLWHNVLVRIDVHGARLTARVDDSSTDTAILGLDGSINYGVTSDLPSVVLIGGLSPEEKLHGVKYIIESFVGCIREIVLSSGKAASDLLPVRPLIASKHENIVEGCIDKCRTRENLCFVGSKCINHYNSLTCDCFGRWYEGEQCDVYTATILTLRGSSYVSYRVYDWKDRVHSKLNRISLFFKTLYDNSALFYASGEPHGSHYIAVSIVNKTVHVEINLGDGAVGASLGNLLTENSWHNLTILHDGQKLRISLDEEVSTLQLPGTKKYFYIDPEIYVAGGPELHKKTGLASHNNFAGSLKYVFYNDISILYELKNRNPKVHYIGVLEPEFYETDVEVIPITLPFPSSHITWSTQTEGSLHIAFDFKSSRNMAVLASSNIVTSTSQGYWQVRLVNEEIRFELVPDLTRNQTDLTTVKFNNRPGWHAVELTFGEGELLLTVDYRNKVAQNFEAHFELGEMIILGTGGKGSLGLVGCLRQIRINGELLEPRYLVRTDHTVGEVSLDNCQLVDPCKRPNACEHGGKCSVQGDQVVCDCKGTGYIGKNCHFAEFRKTCEELALLGYTKPDVYLIDIDGNGRFPPAHVKCEFQSLEDSTKTIVEHNLPSQVDVRKDNQEDFSYTIKYREFSAEMLQELMSHSLRCSQYVRYDCYKAPLELHSATWFMSSAKKDIVDYIGDVKRGACPCAVNRTCVNPSQACNCDILEAKWHSDEGYYTSPKSLGVTEMVFLQQKDLQPDAIGRITLGPLECVETNTQKYVVTFTSSQSYIEVPGWRKGDISFSFRTTGERAILLYQPPIRPHHPSFMVALTNDFQLTFNFTLNTGSSRELEVKSRRKLNGGEWQKIWIDYNEHHVRFMINTDYQMVDLLPEEEFGPFEGSMFIGGATEDLLNKSSVQQGLIGCFRGLVVNGEILDIYSYMSVHLSEIIKDCRPSCDPNPCQNGAKCRELWSSFQCVCLNPWAHLGTFCENNINVKGVTFLTADSYLKRSYLSDATAEDRSIFASLLQDNILVNLRTYDRDSLLLYANDHLNNFVHIYLQDGKHVIFLFNRGSEIQNISVRYPDLSTGRSVQIAIVRTESSTTLHVNEKNVTIPITATLLTEYSNKPWINAEKEVLAPQRPPAPPTHYFQINVGGYDPDGLISVGPVPPLGGYVGCIQGLKIGNHLIDLSSEVQPEMTAVVPGCTMKCDSEPCKNQGVCIEDFQKSESSCDCQFTSYFGDFCDEEKGADFGGESMLQRKYRLEGAVWQVKVQLAFSSSDLRQRNTALLLLQTEAARNYYLLVALSSEGELIFEEDRDGQATGIRLGDRNFLNGARHSVFYQRSNETIRLLIDREEVTVGAMPVLSLSEIQTQDHGSNEAQIGGLNTTDPRFVSYKNYNGCLSNVVIEVNGEVMKPLDEYMHFTKTGSEKVNVKNAAGVRSAQCGFFDLTNKPRPGPSLNISLGRDKAWVEDPPARIPYKSLYSDASTEETGSTQVIFMVLAGVFVAIVVGSLYEVYRSHRRYKKRREQEDRSVLWHQGQPSKTVPYKSVPQQDTKTKAPYNGAETKPAVIRNDYKPNLAPTPEQKKPETQLRRDSGIPSEQQELNWDAVNSNNDLHTGPLRELPASSVEGHEAPKPIPDTLANGAAKPTPFPTIPEGEPVPKVQQTTSQPPGPGAVLSPIFLTEQHRSFWNPISYLGGPRIAYPNSTRASKESVLSVD